MQGDWCLEINDGLEKGQWNKKWDNKPMKFIRKFLCVLDTRNIYGKEKIK